MNEGMLNVSSSPHIRSKLNTSKIMFMVIIALLPATGFGIYNFGIGALITVITCVASCVIAEFVYEKLMKLPVTISDLSAVVTGLLLALNLPSTIPWWISVIGSVFAIIFVKMLFAKFCCKCKIIKCNLQIVLQHFYKILVGRSKLWPT